MGCIMRDELTEYLDALARDDCYRVDAVLKDGAFETTQRVYFVGGNGAEHGPYVRKRFDGDAGLGTAYERIWMAQRAGRRFLHLPRILDCYTAGEHRVVVMEHVRGETLADVVCRCGPSIELACDVFPKVCDAVAELHNGFDPPLIHRDLKPSNIMLNSESLTIIDFGISRTFDDGADDDTRHFGTRSYAPPEQFGYGQTDERSDVYALGMSLYFCLTAKTPNATVRRNGFRDPRIPEAFRRLIERATAFDPLQRYMNVTELCRAFDAAMGAVGLAPESANAGATALPRLQAPTQPASARLCGRPAPFAIPAGPRRPLRIGSKLGVLWDAALLAVLALFAVVATSMVFYPKPTDQAATAPLIVRACEYYSIVLLIIGPALYLLSDRRPFKRLIPPLANVTVQYEVLACAAMFAVGVLMVGVAGLFASPPPGAL